MSLTCPVVERVIIQPVGLPPASPHEPVHICVPLVVVSTQMSLLEVTLWMVRQEQGGLVSSHSSTFFGL